MLHIKVWLLRGFSLCAHGAPMSFLDSRCPSNIFGWHHQYFLLLRTSHLGKKNQLKVRDINFYVYNNYMLARFWEPYAKTHEVAYVQVRATQTALTCNKTVCLKWQVTWTEWGAHSLNSWPRPLRKFVWPITWRVEEKMSLILHKTGHVTTFYCHEKCILMTHRRTWQNKKQFHHLPTHTPLYLVFIVGPSFNKTVNQSCI